jgi:hypothetical protein
MPISQIVTNSIANGAIVQADLAAGVAGTGPTFSAYQGATSILTNNVATKITFNTEYFDTNNNFASSRFTPTVAGYYQINATVTWTAQSASANLIYILKNGSTEVARGARISTSALAFVGLPVSSVIYLNGSTDYVEIYGFTNGGTAETEAGSATVFSGCLVRAA